ncbi:DUF305 domain-containing protein [Nocardia goodfellowii]|uniref:Uncharacterized protein (DUF305 family) n=1 Tax=Nocardia goodfellowii TaxID=882446 RepID=A0ABS4QJK8_9NOCA|nr:DUF305 domain-containing protein [Nocardia goodfellowii]MBP2191894.1 uncharacterized protein (DUF305 family) [Nocardia goodfellowii]
MRRNLIPASALAALGLLLLVIGAAARPLIVADARTSADILTSTEIGFVQDMVAHHQQALLMVASLDPGVHPAVAQLAVQIDRTQRTEIGTMLGWLQLASSTATNPRPMRWMSTATSHHNATPGAPEHMPGNVTRAELDALAAARAGQAESLFLHLMQRHHQGAVAMARVADALLEPGPVKYLARDIVATQSQESGLISVLLETPPW